VLVLFGTTVARHLSNFFTRALWSVRGARRFCLLPRCRSVSGPSWSRSRRAV